MFLKSRRCRLSTDRDRNFWEKPSKRQYPEYYKMIAKPTALIDVKKSVEKGRISSWDIFIEEVRLIWDNAKDFNEEGSVIFDIAETLEVICPVLLGCRPY